MDWTYYDCSGPGVSLHDMHSISWTVGTGPVEDPDPFNP
jgi:hypothetical protein